MIVPVRAATPEAHLSLLVDRHTGVIVEQKPYIRPFERVLAAAELDGLRGRTPDFRRSAAPHELLDADVDVERLRRRLAYAQQVGGPSLAPTEQVRLEASARGDGGVVPTQRLLRYGPHGLHQYRGKFFPQLVRALLNAAGAEPGARVLDPMCGSGTTLVEARVLGLHATGLDMNPLSVRIATAKARTLDLDPARFADAARRLLTRLESQASEPEPDPGWAEADREYLDRWFAPAALHDVARIQAAIAAESDASIRGVFEVCLSDVLRGVSWQKDVDLRVRKEVTEYRREAAVEAFAHAITRQVERLLPYLHVLAGRGPFPDFEVREGDARRIDESHRRRVGQCDVLVTSPPYAMALPYLDTDRLSLCVLGLLPRVGHRRRESAMVGTREITERERERLWAVYLERKSALPDRATRLIDALGEVNHRKGEGDEVGFRRRNLPALLAKYFLDMRDVMANALEMMRSPGAWGFWVVGNNSTQVRGDRVEIPTDELLFEIGESVGWRPHAMLDMQLLPSRDIFRKNRGSAEKILALRAGTSRRAVYSSAGIETDEDWSFRGADTQEHLHGLHPYPARFIPQIPRRAIEEWSKPGERVLDPFAGGGTTLLEASLAGRPSIGVDNNAVANLIARAKTHVYTKSEHARLERFASRVEAGELEGLEPSIPEYPNRAHWFSDAALVDLGRLRAGIERLDAAPRHLALAVFSAVLLRASRQDSDTRYARVEREYVPGRAARWFASRLRDALGRIETIRGLPRAAVEHRLGDGRALRGIEEGSVDLLITSPPYLNAYDYHKYHRHRLHWIGGDVAFARDREIGKHDTFTRPGARPEPYFDDMGACFAEWARVLRPGAVAVIVVGDAIVGGEPVAVGDRFTALLAERGLPVEHRFLRRLDTGRKSFNQRARIDAEHVLVARRE